MQKKDLISAKPAILPFPIKKIIYGIKSAIKATHVITIPEHLREKDLLLKIWLIYLYRIGNTEPFVIHFKNLSKARIFLAANFSPNMQFSDVAKAITQQKKIDFQNVPIAIIITNQLEKCSLLSNSLFTVAINASGNQFRIIYNEALLEKDLALAMIKNMSGHIKTIIETIKKKPHELITQLPILTKTEQQKILVDWNKTKKPYPKNKTIQELFEQQVKKTPNNIAVVFEDKNLTYKELNQKANQLANYLRNFYKTKLNTILKSDTLIGLCIKRSLEMIIGILGILKASGAYVPLDPTYPKERLQFMLQDSEAKLVLTQKEILEELSFLEQKKREVVCLDSDWLQISKSATSNPQLINRAQNLTYVIYTSGSTGMPKGVMLSHQNVVNLMFDVIDKLKVSQRDRLLSITSISFDIFVLELWTPLLSGATHILCNREVVHDPVQLTRYMKEMTPTIMQATPSTWEMLIDFVKYKPSKLAILCGGEPLPQNLAEKLLKLGHPIWNVYGPTETTVWSTYLSLKDAAKIYIGKGFANTTCYVVDSFLNPMPIGILGELHIGGDGLARGYFKRKTLTQERFIANPFAKGERLYKTGDLVRWLPDGNIEFFGRIDFQIKIRGFRIELGEIETLLSQNANIKQCVVTVYEENGEKQLVAYYIPRKKQAISSNELREFLDKQLPDYMIPSFFVQMQKFPLTPNKKIDRKALPAPSEAELVTEEEYLAPRNEEERILAEIWSEVLKLERIGVNDNFFNLGGNSLNAIRVISHINHALQIECPLKAIFDFPTIARLAVFAHDSLSGLKIAKRPIQKVDRKQPLLLSFAEQRLWFLDQYEASERAIYNIPIVFKLVGPLNIAILEKSFNYLIKRHESLRTVFKSIAGKPSREILATYSLKLQLEKGNIKKLATAIIQEGNRPFDLANEPLIRVKLFSLNKNEFILLINQHHIISDGWSVEILIEELNIVYNSLIKKQMVKLPKLTAQYAAFAHWQRQWLRGEILNTQINYWRNKLKDYTELNLPTDFSRPAVKTYNGKHYQFSVNKQLTSGLNDLSHEAGATLFMVLLTVFNVLLSRYSNQEDIVVGSPIANRNHPAIENIIGFFVNTLALRNDLGGNPSFSNLLDQVKQTCLDAYAYQDIPFERLVDELQIPRDVSRNPIFQIMFVLQSAGTQELLSFPKMTAERLSLDYKIAKFDLVFELVESEKGLNCTIEYNTDLYRTQTIVRMAQHYKVLLQGIVQKPKQKIHALPLLTKIEQQKILIDWNKTEKPYPKDKTIHELFEKQVQKIPDNIAIVFADTKLTYKELNQKANQLAHTLRKMQQNPMIDTIIGLCIDRSLEMMVGILGILKAGGAYLPLDPTYPKERLQFMSQDSGVKIILSQKHVLKQLPFLKKNKQLICLDSDWGKIAKSSSENLKNINKSTDLAYVIYTSGSTGMPKGTLLEHHGVCNLATYLPKRFGIKAKTRVLQFASICFDASVYEWVSTLSAGGELYLLTAEELPPHVDVADILENKRIQVTMLPPAVLETMQQKKLTHLKTIISGGDDCSINIVNAWSPNRKFINAYGPTECTVCATMLDCTPGQLPNIGRPIANVHVYVLDKHLNSLPIGVPGELHIGGAGLGRGYLNRSDLTQEKFIANPFNKAKKLYKTGDLIRWLPNGNLEFLGRIDNQVKIRGFRIELGEIDSILSMHAEIKKCLVIAREERGEKQLVAYYIAKKAKSIAVDELRNMLSKQLPDYMMPAIFVHMKAFPLTSSGKIDRKALPEPIDYEVMKGKEYIAPRNEKERILMEIWSEILSIKHIGVNDNFFNLGGHSLNAIQVISRINETFKIESPIKVLFENPTIEQLAIFISEQLSTTKLIKQPIKIVNREQALLLSFAEQRLWFLDKYEEAEWATYNIPIGIKLTGPLNIEALEKSINFLIQRHEGFRTSFATVNGTPRREIIPEYRLTIKPKTIKGKELIKALREEAHQPFDLAIVPLMRVKLFKIGINKHVLIINQHHIISDGLSVVLFLKELNQLYINFINQQDPQLPDLSVQYVDYAYWQRQWLQGELLKLQIDYWRTKLQDFTGLDLPTDFPRPAVKTYKGKHYQFLLGQNLLTNLQALSSKTQTTLFMVLLGVFNILLARLSGQEDIVVGSPIADRNHPALESIIGFFVNTLALRNDLSGNPGFLNLLPRIKQTCLDAYAHQDVPFERLIDELQIKRDVSNTPIFQVMLVLQNIGEQINLSLPDIEVEKIRLDYDIAKFDLTFNLFTTQTGLACEIEYNADIYTDATIHRMAKHFKVLLHGVVANPNEPIQYLPLLTDAERKQILIDWNKTAKPYPKDKTIHELFEQQVKKTPNNMAVVFEDKNLTYKELNQKANQLAHYLRNKCDGKPLNDVLIGLCVERSLEMIIGILGILKAGAAYVPLDPKYPKERLRFMLKDSETKIVLSQKHVLKQLPFLERNRQVICLDRDLMEIAKFSSKNPKLINKSTDLAYMIYTSGSTGLPKGVLIEHNGVCNLAGHVSKKLNITTKTKVLQFASICFDASVWECVSTLTIGGELHLLTTAELPPHADVTDVLETKKIQVVTLSPAVLETMQQKQLPHLKTIVSAGEACSINLVNIWGANRKFINAYGPTECTVCATMLDCLPGKFPNIGAPIANVHIYILDKDLNPVPIGVPGEMHIGGAGIARGYLNRPELTQEKFIANPFNKTEKLYKTGDLVHWLPNGNLEFLGRIDNQVKIRGFRIELGEIEARLAKHPDISQAIVTVHEENGEKQLVAYYVSKKDKAIAVDLLRNRLSKKLPDYMVPAFFVRIKKFLLTSSGKIDRKALPEPVAGKLLVHKHYIESRNIFEMQLRSIWSSLLRVEKISMDDDFFTLGGHSLLAIRLVTAINKQFNVNNSVAWIFQQNTVEKQANALKDQKIKAAYQPVLGFNERGTKSPLFFIHGGVSGAEMYIELANLLSKKQPFYAIESYNLYSGKPIVNSIKKLAAKYIKYMQRIQPQGPYYLGGWSLGGIIAYEMAQLLVKQNQEVKKLYLIDSFCLDKKEQKKLLRFYKAEKYILRLDDDSDEQFPDQYREYVTKIGHAEIMAMAAYKTMPYTGKVILFKANKSEKIQIEKDSLLEVSYKLFIQDNIFPKQDNGWKVVVKNPQIELINGTHKSIMHGNALKQITKIIQQL